MLQIKRAYNPVEKLDGYRILIDRLWPRGLSKEELKIDWWPKEITPSTEIRKAFKHDEANFSEFIKAYTHELDENSVTEYFISEIKKLLKTQNVTLVYGAKNTKINHAIVLKNYIEKHL